MALPIQGPPELRGKEAEEFIRKADEAFLNRGTVDFSKEFETMRKILKKARL